MLLDKYNNSLLTLLLIASISIVQGQVPFVGRCPGQTVVTPFNATQYLGQWYEQQRYFTIFQVGGKCVTAIYTDAGNGQVGVDNAQVNSVTGKASTIQGFATFAESPLVGKLTVRFPSTGNMPAPYWVLDTDYYSYSIVWACTDILNVINTQFLWLLTREKNPSAEFVERVRKIIKIKGLNTDALRRHVQDCL